MTKPLTPTMAIALAEAHEHGGQLVRHVGGLWSYPNCPRRLHDGSPEWWVGTSTVEALVTRGVLAYTEWKQGRDYRFPIVAEVTPLAQAAPDEGAD